MEEKKEKKSSKGLIAILIAVILLLLGLAVYAFLGINQNKLSSDIELVRRLNVCLDKEYQGTDKKSNTAYDAVTVCAKYGYLVDVINPTSDMDIAWYRQGDYFVLIDTKKATALYPSADKETDLTIDKKEDFFIFRNGLPTADYETDYSVFAIGKWDNEVTLNGIGFDAGYQLNIEGIHYGNSKGAEKDVIIRSVKGVVNVNAPTDTIYHYGFAVAVNCVDVKAGTLNEDGTVGRLIYSDEDGAIQFKDLAKVYCYMNTTGDEKADATDENKEEGAIVFTNVLSKDQSNAYGYVENKDDVDVNDGIVKIATCPNHMTDYDVVTVGEDDYVLCKCCGGFSLFHNGILVELDENSPMKVAEVPLVGAKSTFVFGNQAPSHNHAFTWDGNVGNGKHTLVCECESTTQEDCDNLGKDGACSVCGFIGHTHTYTLEKYDMNNHWVECECGEKKDVTAHSYTIDKHDANNHWKECACGITSGMSTHTFTVKADGTNHWEECSCGEKKNVTAHSFTTEKYDMNNHWTECVCGAKKNVTAHSYTIDKHDANNHWKECTCGITSGMSTHTFNYQGDAATHWEECSCGEKKASSAHAFTLDKSDATNHWSECVCGAKKNVTVHSYTIENHDKDNHWMECVCGAKNNEEAHSFTYEIHNDMTHSEKCTECDYTTSHEAHAIGSDYICTKCQKYCAGFYDKNDKLLLGLTTKDSEVEAGKCIKIALDCVSTDNNCNKVNTAFNATTNAVKIVLPHEVTSIGYDAFKNNSKLETIVMGDSLTLVDGWAFYKNTSLKNVVFGKNVTEIGGVAFAYCSSLTEINFPSKLKTIGATSFSNCKGLTNIVFPNSVEEIGSIAFMGCSKLASVTLPINANFKAINNDVFRETGLTSIVIPASVEGIWGNAFYDCGRLKTVIFAKGSNLDTIGPSAFSWCNNMTVIACEENLTVNTLPSKLKDICMGAFNSCKSLEDIVLPDSLVHLGVTGKTIYKGDPVDGHIFAGCEKLKTITIPAGIDSIKDDTFCNCKNLTSIIFKGTKAQWIALEKEIGYDKTGGTTKWDYNTGNYTVHCTDGDIAKN